MNDWAAPSIKLQALHKRLDDCLNMKKHSEAFSILLEMQGEVLKLQRFVIGYNDASKMNEVADPAYPQVKIGKYTICRQDENSVWIQTDCGEGGQFTDKAFFPAVDTFYCNNF